VVVVHGGGNVISQWMQRQGLAPNFVNGLRVTDAPSLEIVVAVLGGLINKELVSLIHEFGGRSVGLSGVDGCMVEAKIGNPDLGFVGEVTTINSELIRSVLDSGFIPMIAPIGVHVRDGSENAGSPLNINGDTVAGELAYALEAEQLVFLTDVTGVMDGGGRVIRRLDRRRANILSNSGVIQGGMIPKLSACLRALECSPVANIIDGRQPDALIECIRGNSTGTTIVSDFRSRR
jgi:acetylglutamate kinase